MEMNPTTLQLEQKVDELRESSRKLQVLTEHYAEDSELIGLAFQDYVTSVKALLAEADHLKPPSQPELNAIARELTVCVKSINRQIKQFLAQAKSPSSQSNGTGIRTLLRTSEDAAVRLQNVCVLSPVETASPDSEDDGGRFDIGHETTPQKSSPTAEPEITASRPAPISTTFAAANANDLISRNSSLNEKRPKAGWHTPESRNTNGEETANLVKAAERLNLMQGPRSASPHKEGALFINTPEYTSQCSPSYRPEVTPSRSVTTSPAASYARGIYQQPRAMSSGQNRFVISSPAASSPAGLLLNDSLYKLVERAVRTQGALRGILKLLPDDTDERLIHDLSAVEQEQTSYVEEVRLFSLHFKGHLTLMDQRQQEREMNLVNGIKTHDRTIHDLEAQVRRLEQSNQFLNTTLRDMVDENTVLKGELNKYRSVDGNKRLSQSITSPPLPQLKKSVSSGSKHAKKHHHRRKSSGRHSYFSDPEAATSDIEEDINYVDAFRVPNSEKNKTSTVQDPEIIKVQKLLAFIEKRKKKHLEELKNTGDLKRPGLRQLARKSPPAVTTIQDREFKRRIAAIHIQRVYRGFKSRKVFRHALLRRLIVREIYETEISYVKGLFHLVTDYMNPLLDALASDGSPVLPKDKIDVIFYQVRDLILLHAALLSKLYERTSRWNQWSTIGDVFLDKAPQFEMYTLFVNNYSNALSLFQECATQGPFKNFLANVKSTLPKGSLSLSDYLITPIQRVPRYVLLLKELLKHTVVHHRDYKPTSDAIVDLQRVAEIINNQKRDAEHLEELNDLQSKITGFNQSLAEHGRRLLISGELTELVEVNKKKLRQVFLFNDMIVCTNVPQKSRFTSFEKNYEFRWMMMLAETHIGPIEKLADRSIADFLDEFSYGGLAFVGSSERHLLFASSAEEHSRWVELVNEIKSEQRANRSSEFSAKIQRQFTQPPGSYCGTITFVRDTRSEMDPKDYIDAEAAMKSFKDRIFRLDVEIQAETKVLAGLERLDRVYHVTANNNIRDKVKVQNQRQETAKFLQTLSREIVVLRDCLRQLEAFYVVYLQGDPAAILLIDRKDVTKVVIDPLPLTERVVRYVNGQPVPLRRSSLTMIPQQQQQQAINQ